MVTLLRTPYLALLTALAVSVPVSAAEWVAEPAVSVRGEYDDNIRLTTAEHDSVWGLVLEPRLDLSRRSELWDLSTRARVRASQYPDEDQLDTTDAFLDIASKRRFERGAIEASVGVADDTTLQNEFLDIDTGLTANQIDRMRTSARLAGEYMFTEKTWLELSTSYSKVDYDNGERYGLLDYDYLTPAARLIHQLNPKTQVFGIYSYSKADYDTGTELESKTHSLQLGAAYDITERWNISGSIGSRRTETSSVVTRLVAPTPGLEFLCGFLFPCDTILVPRDSKSTGVVYDANLTREFETGSIKLSASQSIIPTSTGTDSESTQIGLTGIRNFSTKLRTQLAISYLESATVGGTTTRADTERYRIAPSLTWRLDEALSLNAGYTYTRIKRDYSRRSNTADGNLVFVSLAYAWPRMAMSR
ncbi:MAG: outer membrane beta-barrel protein [Thiohalobacteraceae bacterium]